MNNFSFVEKNDIECASLDIFQQRFVSNDYMLLVRYDFVYLYNKKGSNHYWSRHSKEMGIYNSIRSGVLVCDCFL